MLGHALLANTGCGEVLGCPECVLLGDSIDVALDGLEALLQPLRRGAAYSMATLRWLSIERCSVSC